MSAFLPPTSFGPTPRRNLHRWSLPAPVRNARCPHPQRPLRTLGRVDDLTHTRMGRPQGGCDRNQSASEAPTLAADFDTFRKKTADRSGSRLAAASFNLGM